MAGFKVFIFCAFLAISSLSANPIRMASEFYKQAGTNEEDVWRPHSPQLNFNPLAPHVRLQNEPVIFIIISISIFARHSSHNWRNQKLFL